VPRCLAWVRGTWSPHLQPQQSLSHPSAIQRQAGRFPRPLPSYSHQQTTSKRGSSASPFLLAQANAAAHQQAHGLPRGSCGSSAGLSPRWPRAPGLWGGCLTATGTWAARHPSARRWPLRQAASRRHIPEPTLVFLRTNFYLRCRCRQKIACVPSLPSVIFFHVQS